MDDGMSVETSGRRGEDSRPDRRGAFREGAEDVLRGPFGEPVYWFCPERFQLPLWPEFLLRIRWSRAESVTHYSSYVYALEFPLYGDLTLVSRDREVVVTPGSVGIIHRGEYSLLKAGPSGFCSKLSIGLRGVILSSLFASCGLSGKLVVQLKQPERTGQIFHELERLLLRRESAEISRISALGMELFNLLVLSASGPPDEEFSRILNLFTSAIPKRCTIAELAGRLAISPVTLERLFRRHTGKSPKRYLHELKMETARELLRGGRSSVQEVAFRVGYEDPLAFSRAFRNYAGCPPREFLRTGTADCPENC